MFIDSVLDGLSALTFWRFWAVTLGVGFGALIPILVVGMLANANEGLGCLITPFVFVFPSILLIFILILLFPIIVFQRNEIGWTLLSHFSLVEWIKIVGIGFLALFIVAWIPIIGQLNSIAAFAQAASNLATMTYIISLGTAEIWPGFLPAIGLAVIGGIVSLLIGYGIALVILALLGEEVATVVAQPIGIIPSVVAATMYGGWLHQANNL